MRRILTPPISQSYEIQHKLFGLLVFTAVSAGLMSLVRVYYINHIRHIYIYICVFGDMRCSTARVSENCAFLMASS